MEQKIQNIRIEDLVLWTENPCDPINPKAPWHSDIEIKINRLGYVIKNGAKTNGFLGCHHLF